MGAGGKQEKEPEKRNPATCSRWDSQKAHISSFVHSFQYNNRETTHPPRNHEKKSADPKIHPSTALASAPTVGKTALKENTDQAFADGAFGLPWMVCTNSRGQTEGFWGVDHMGQVLQFMGLERPREGGWKSLL